MPWYVRNGAISPHVTSAALLGALAANARPPCGNRRALDALLTRLEKGTGVSIADSAVHSEQWPASSSAARLRLAAPRQVGTLFERQALAQWPGHSHTAALLSPDPSHMACGDVGPLCRRETTNGTVLVP